MARFYRMPRFIAALACTAVLVTLTPLPAGAQNDTDPNRQMIARIRQVLEQRPDDPTLHYFLASFQARAGDRDDALASLRQVERLGDGILPVSDVGFAALANDPDFIALRAALERRLPTVADAPVAFRIPDPTFIPEGIAHDARSGHFYVGSIAQNRIVRIDPKGRITPFSRPDDGLQHVLGLAVDSRRRRLYAVSTNAFAARGAPLVNNVVRYDLRSGKRDDIVQIDGAAQLNDLALAPNGDVYASDSGSGAIWRVYGKDARAQALLPAGSLPGVNGIAVTDDGTTLYAAHSTGLARVNLATARVERMTPPPRQSVAAIDGLYWSKGALIGIQNVTNPGRVIRIRLGAGGMTAVDTLQSHHHPAFDEPTTGAIAGDAIYVLGTTQVGQFDEQGAFRNPAALKPPAIVRVPLR